MYDDNDISHKCFQLENKPENIYATLLRNFISRYAPVGLSKRVAAAEYNTALPDERAIAKWLEKSKCRVKRQCKTGKKNFLIILLN